MSMRTLLMATAMVCLLGCPADEGDMQAERTTAPVDMLRIEGDEAITLLPGEHAPLVVRYVDLSGQPVEGIDVEFALTDSPEGASLEAARVTTDSDGEAMTTLVAGRATVVGSVASSFRVRASADKAEPSYFTVQVVKAADPTLVVNVKYTGKRPVKSYSLLVVEGMLCDQLRGNSIDTRMSSSLAPGDAPDRSASQTIHPGAGRSYAIAAWGSDDSNSKLAWGCKDDYTAPVSDTRDQAAVSDSRDIELADLEFTASTPIRLNFSFDVSQALLSLVPQTRTLIGEALPKTSTPQASYLLDLLQGKVDANARKSEGLDAELSRMLDAASSGPLAFAEALTRAMADDGATCLLQGRLTPLPDKGGNSTLSLDTVSVVAAGSVAKEVSGTQLLATVSEFSARYDQATAMVNVSTLKVALGFGSYVTYLSSAVSQQPGLYLDRISASTGCDELGALVNAHPNSFPGASAMEAVASCRNALMAMAPQIQSAWTAMNDQRNMLSLAGQLAAHDRDGDKMIDDLGPVTLDGAWSTATGSSSAGTALKVNVRMAPVTVSAR